MPVMFVPSLVVIPVLPAILAVLVGMDMVITIGTKTIEVRYPETEIRHLDRSTSSRRRRDLHELAQCYSQEIPPVSG